LATRPLLRCADQQPQLSALPSTAIHAAADPRNGTDWSDVTFVHCVRWQDNAVGQIGIDPVSSKSTAFEIWRDRGAHVSNAVIIEMQIGTACPRPTVPRSRHPVQPEPRCRHEHDHAIRSP